MIKWEGISHGGFLHGEGFGKTCVVFVGSSPPPPISKIYWMINHARDYKSRGKLYKSGYAPDIETAKLQCLEALCPPSVSLILELSN